MKRVLAISCSVLVSITSSAQQFDDHKFLTSLNQTQYKLPNKSILFVKNLVDNKLNDAEKIFPLFKKMDVKGSLSTIDGETYLSGLSDFLKPYILNSDTLLLATLYLKKKYNTKNSLYDNMLRACLRLDSTNYPAMYFLAKLRHEHGFNDDSDYLVYRMNLLYEGEASWLDVIIDKLIYKDWDLREFLEKHIYYMRE